MSESGTSKPRFHIIFTAIAVIFVTLLVFKPVMKWFFPVKYIDEIKKHSNDYRIDEHLIMAVISTESKFNTNAVSHKNAIGLMQLKEDTALWCIERFKLNCGNDISRPDNNIQIGCAYLCYLIKKFDNIETALAAYNAGEGNVSEWLENQPDDTRLVSIPFNETENYVNKVLKREKIYNFLY